jgi:hypothetical protein
MIKAASAGIARSSRGRFRRPAACASLLAMGIRWLGIPAWLLCGVIGAWIATSKGRGGCFWFCLCALLGPLGIILAAIVSRTE